MPDDPDVPRRPGDDDLVDDRLRALVSDAGSDAPTPPDFREAVMSDTSTAMPPPPSDHRKLVAWISAGLAVAAGLALFFLVPLGEDDAVAPADSDPTVRSSITSIDTAPVSTQPDTTIDEAPVDSAPAAPPITGEPPATISTSPPKTTTTTTTTTTAITTTTASATAPPPAEPVAAIDLAAGTVFDVGVFETVDPDAVVSSVTGRLGTPALDTAWRPMPDQSSCFGSNAFRTVWWGDLRLTFERYETDGAVTFELAGWSVGDPAIVGLVPVGEVPEGVATLVTTSDGITVGSSRADLVAVADNTFEQDNLRLTVLTGGTASLFQFDDADRVTGFGIGPFDCPSDEDV